MALCLLSGAAPGAPSEPGIAGRATESASSAESNNAEEASASDDQVPAPAKSSRWRVELKRQEDSRGTPGETTKTVVRLEALPDDGPVSLLRLDLQFPDDKTSFSGNPFDPRLGDTKVRVKTRPVEVASLPLSALLEVWLPTANPESLGQGKYQVSPGIETSLPLTSLSIGASRHTLSFEPLIQQFASVAGDSMQPDINYTKFELAIRDVWRKDYYLKFTLKPVLDWEQNGQTGAVAELEGGLAPYRGWKLTLMLGARVWGPSNIPTTYEDRVELTAGRTF